VTAQKPCRKSAGGASIAGRAKEIGDAMNPRAAHRDRFVIMRIASLVSWTRIQELLCRHVAAEAPGGRELCGNSARRAQQAGCN
jgi:hypothetical protein